MIKIPDHLKSRLPTGALAKLSALEEQHRNLGSDLSGRSMPLSDLGKHLNYMRQQRAALAEKAQRQGVDAKTLTQPVPAIDSKPRPLMTFDGRPKMVELGSATAPILRELAQLDQEIAKATDERGRVAARQAEQSGRNQKIADLLRSIQKWLEALPSDATLAEHPAKSAVAQKNREAVTPEIIEKRQRRARELIADIRQTDAAPYPNETAKKLMRAKIEQLAERGRPSFFALIERGEEIGWPEMALPLIGFGVSNQTIPDVLSLFAWQHRDALIAASEKAIDEDAGAGGHGLSDEVRADAFRRLFAELLAAEREEETLIEAALFEVDRRVDADPRAVLGLSAAVPGPDRGLFHRRLINL